MNPTYNNSVPFYPTIPNQNPINTFFPNQMHHNGQYAPHFQHAVYPNPAPLNVPYPPSFGYNSNRSVLFPPPNQRPVYHNLGLVNPDAAPIYPNNHHNLVNPDYYRHSGTGMTCGCANPSHNPVLANANHVPPYPRLVHVGNLVYQLPNSHNSTQFNPSNAGQWPSNQNNTYYQPADNATNANWNHRPNANQNPSSYTLPARNPTYPPSHNYNDGHHAASGNNRSWVPYSTHNTFRPIPDENIDDLSECSLDLLSSPSERDLAGSTPDLPVSSENIELPKDPAPNAADSVDLSSSECTLEVGGNHTDINQNSENVINNQENLETSATNTVSSLDEPICSDVQEEPVPTTSKGTSLTDAHVAKEDLTDFDTQSADSDQVGSDSTTAADQSSNNTTDTPSSTVNTAVIENCTETVLESNDTGLNQVENSCVLRVDIENIEISKASEQDQIVDESISQTEKNSGNLTNATEPKLGDESVLETTTSSANLEVENSTPNSTSVSPPSSSSSPTITTPNSTETNLDHTYHTINDCPTVLKTGTLQHLNNNTEKPNSKSQPKPQLEQQRLDSSTTKPNYETSRRRYVPEKLNFPTQISTNFRYLLIRYLNRLDNVKINTNPNTSYLNIDDDLINSFVASLNPENRRLLDQDPKNIATGSLTNVTQNVSDEAHVLQNVSDENQANLSNSKKNDPNAGTKPKTKQNQANVSKSEKNEADQKADTAPEPKKNQANVSNSEKNDPNAGTKPETEQNQANLSNSEKNEPDQKADTASEPKKNQANVSNSEKNEPDQNTVIQPEQYNVLLAACADREETSINEDNSTEFQQQLNEYQPADDVDVINTNLDTIEVTVGDVCNNSIEVGLLEDVPLDLAKEKQIPETDKDVKSRYFEVSQFLPKGNMYLEYFDTPCVQDKTTVYAPCDNANANYTGSHSVDVLVEVPLNLSCKNRSRTAESQKQDIASNYPELSLLLTADAIQSTLNTGAKGKAKNGIATKKKEFCLIETALSKLLTKHSPDISEPPKKKIRVNAGEPKIVQSLLKNDKPNM